jgi:hypothetical protein
VLNLLNHKSSITGLMRVWFSATHGFPAGNSCSVEGTIGEACEGDEFTGCQSHHHTPDRWGGGRGHIRGEKGCRGHLLR